MKTKVPGPMATTEEIKAFCLRHVVPDEIWRISYDKENLDEWKEGYPTNTFNGPGPFPEWKQPPVHIGAIDFPELIEDLENELSECSSSQLNGLRVKEEIALACVRLTRWLLENGRL